MNMNMLFHERYFSSRIMCIKGFVNRLSHDCQKDIDRGVSTSYSRSSSGNGVDLLSRTICTRFVMHQSLTRMVVQLVLLSNI